jgi:hypothetical protein
VEVLARLALADGVPGLSTGVTVTFAIAVAIVGLLGRRSMPAGVGVGTFVAGVSGAAIVLLAVDSTGSLSRSAFAHVLTALTALWYAASRLAARSATRVSPASGPWDRGHDASVWAYAALACGLAAVANLASMPKGFNASDRSAGATDLVVLVALSALIRVFRTGAWATYPTIALLVYLLVVLAPKNALEARASAWGIGLNAAALLSLAAVLASVLRDWRRQRRRWLEQLDAAVADPAGASSLSAILVIVCVLVGLGGMLFRGYWFTPTALWLAALACLAIGHVRGWLVVGEIGLVLVAEGVVFASMAWLTPGWPGALLGLVLAGSYLVWLARFWNQQLLDGRAWTTAGRLIPASRRLGYMASSGAVAAAIAGLATGAFAEQSAWLGALTLLLLLILMGLLTRDGLEFGQPSASAASCLVAVAAAGPECALFARLAGTPLMSIVGVAIGALLLSLCVALGVRRSRQTKSDLRGSAVETGPGHYTLAGWPVYAAFVGGVLPVAVLLVLSWRGVTLQTVVAVGVTLAAAMIGGFVLRAAKRAERREVAD